MPELPEVETTKTSLFPLLNQKVLSVEVRNPSLRWPIPDNVQKLVGQRLIGLNRRSKYILAEFEQDQMLWHLGMSGSFRLCQPNDELRKHDHLILWLNPETQGKLIDTLGPEPLSTDFHAEYLASKLKNKSVGIKIALMDNHVVVGVGNIYATESLFNVGIHDLGGSTLRDYSNAMGENGYFQQTLLAYGRAGEMCVNCETTLENLKLGQRASVFCPQCQPLKKLRKP